jgi:tryptophanyl-tRNA synthetase
MAADILLYDSNQVPVGQGPETTPRSDARSRGETQRNLRRGHRDPAGPIIREDTAVVVGLDGRKMSKSYHNTLPIFGEEKPLKKLIMKITTDSTPVEEPKPVENSTILALYKLFASEADYQRWWRITRSGGVGYGDFKKRLAEAYWDFSRRCARAARRFWRTRDMWTACWPTARRGRVRNPPRCWTASGARWAWLRYKLKN